MLWKNISYKCNYCSFVYTLKCHIFYRQKAKNKKEWKNIDYDLVSNPLQHSTYFGDLKIFEPYS